MSTLDPFAFDTSAHEVFIWATLDVESQHKIYSRSQRGEGTTISHARRPTVDPINFPDGRHATLASHEARHVGGDKRGRHKHHAIKITTLTPFLSFGHDVLIDRVISLQKRALVGKWHFVELGEGEMRNWVETKWKLLLGYCLVNLMS